MFSNFFSKVFGYGESADSQNSNENNDMFSFGGKVAYRNQSVAKRTNE